MPNHRVAQELMSPELMKQVQAYERQVEGWQVRRTAQLRGAGFAMLVAAYLWTASYLTSSATGPVNQATWFTALTFFSFIGALVASLVAVVVGGIWLTSTKPLKNFTVERWEE